MTTRGPARLRGKDGEWVLQYLAGAPRSVHPLVVSVPAFHRPGTLTLTIDLFSGTQPLVTSVRVPEGTSQQEIGELDALRWHYVQVPTPATALPPVYHAIQLERGGTLYACYADASVTPLGSQREIPHPQILPSSWENGLLMLAQSPVQLLVRSFGAWTVQMRPHNSPPGVVMQDWFPVTLLWHEELLEWFPYKGAHPTIQHVGGPHCLALDLGAGKAAPAIYPSEIERGQTRVLLEAFEGMDTPRPTPGAVVDVFEACYSVRLWRSPATVHCFAATLHDDAGRHCGTLVAWNEGLTGFPTLVEMGLRTVIEPVYKVQVRQVDRAVTVFPLSTCPRCGGLVFQTRSMPTHALLSETTARSARPDHG